MSWGAVAGAVIGGGLSLAGAKKAANAQSGAADAASQAQLQMFEQNRADMAPWREAGVGALSQLLRGLGIELPEAETYDAIRARLAPQFTDPKYGGNGVDDMGLDAAAREEFNNQAPRRAGAGGGMGLGDLNRRFSMADYEADPGYGFRRDEGLRGIEGSAVGRGMLLSGATLKALNKYNSDLASQEYGNAYNRFNADMDRRFNRLSSIAGTGQTATRDVGQMGQQTAASVGQNIIGGGNARASGYVGAANALGGAAQGIGNYYQLNQLLGRQQRTPWSSVGAGFPSGVEY